MVYAEYPGTAKLASRESAGHQEARVLTQEKRIG